VYTASLLTLSLLLAVLPAGSQIAPSEQWVAPDTERGKASPVPVTPEGIDRGRHLFREHCATCHGETGKGDGPSSKLHAFRTSRPPHDLTDASIQTMLADGEIFWKMTAGYRRDGKVIMPAYGKLVPSDEDRWRIVQYVRTLGHNSP
jgi:mono/diheme cytochrome c family protein